MHDWTRRSGVSRRRAYRGVAGRLARTRAHPPRHGDRSLLPDRSELVRHDAERPPRATRFRRSRRREAGKRRRDGPARYGAHRTRGHGVPRFPAGAMIALLLWARFVFLALVAALVVLYFWIARSTNDEH